MSDPEHILMWRRITPQITTSGQPSETELEEIKNLGVSHVINLGPHDEAKALADEEGAVTALGMTYIHIPVDFTNPEDADFDAFDSALAGLTDTKIHVHCIYNARVSAFFYRYAKAGKLTPVAEAHARMDSIWRPGDDWADFIGEAEAKAQPNRYAGEDY